MNHLIKDYKKMAKYELSYDIIEKITTTIESKHWSSNIIDNKSTIFKEKREIVVNLSYNHKVIQIIK